MKPTIQQVVAHFGLPDEAVESEELKKAIRWAPEMHTSIDEMRMVQWSFVQRNGRSITDWFKPNHGMDDK